MKQPHPLRIAFEIQLMRLGEVCEPTLTIRTLCVLDQSVLSKLFRRNPKIRAYVFKDGPNSFTILSSGPNPENAKRIYVVNAEIDELEYKDSIRLNWLVLFRTANPIFYQETIECIDENNFTRHMELSQEPSWSNVTFFRMALEN